MKVLVVDDSGAVRTRLIALLQEARGDDARPAHDAEQALEAMECWGPALVLLDLHLPGRSGLDIIGDLKAHEPPPVVIVLTGDATPYHRAECLRRGADFFLDKAGDLGRLLSLIDALDRGERPTLL